MERIAKYLVIVAICCCSLMGTAEARDLTISLPLLPPLVESRDKGILVDLCKAMAEEYKDGKITWGVFPPVRSLDNVEKGKADIQMPYIAPKNQKMINLQYGSEVLYKVIFVLYTNKDNKEISPKNLTKYKVETDEAIKYIFTDAIPNITGSPNMESSLQKLGIGRIDAWLLSMRESDMALRKLGLRNIKRWEYEKYDVKALLPIGEKGKETDRILSGLIKKLKANGRYQKIMAPVLKQKYENWQP